MTAKATTHDTIQKDGVIVAYKMKATIQILKGAPVLVNAAGYAYSNDGTTNTISNGDIFVGFCVETMTGGSADGDVDVRVFRKGTVVQPTTVTVAQANIGDPVFVNNATDDAGVTITADTGNPQVTVGEIVEFISANEARIAIDNHVGTVAANG